MMPSLPRFDPRCGAALSSAASFSAATWCGGQLRLQQMSSRCHKLPVDLELAGVSAPTSRSAGSSANATHDPGRPNRKERDGLRLQPLEPSDPHKPFLSASKHQKNKDLTIRIRGFAALALGNP